MIIRESSLQKGLPKETVSLCPECKSIIKARIFEEDDKVMIDKTCEQHASQMLLAMYMSPAMAKL